MIAIKKYRKQHNMTQQQLADALNVTQSAVNHWEKGNAKPMISKLFQMAQLFGCTVDELIKDDEQ